MNVVWKEVNPIVKSFLDEEEGLHIFIIKTGFKDKYIVTFDDAHEQQLGYTEILTKEEIIVNYGIRI